MLTVTDLKKNFGQRTAVSDLSLTLEEGRIFGMLGTNGAGKSTLLRLMCGILRPDAGAAFLDDLPTILENEEYIFVHGGVPREDRLEELDAWACMKNDDFLGQGFTFDKWVIVGHWPVTLYDPAIPCAAPLVEHKRRIISIDGGCVLKLDGQLNALIIPSEESSDFCWQAYDGLPTVVALDDQLPSPDSVNIRWGRSSLELVEQGEELSVCRHCETGRVLPVLNEYLHTTGDSLWCEDSTDYRLPVSAGDRLRLVQSTHQGHLCKKNGVTGWYFGRIEP